MFDQHANFVSLEPRLFSLNQVESYRAYNDPKIPDTQIENTMNTITQGLFSVLATLGTIPVIRCSQSEGPARMVAEQLNNEIRDHLV